MKYFLNGSEKQAVSQCIEFGKQWGYGNMIDRLHKAWALYLMESCNFSVYSACLGAHMDEEEARRISKIPREVVLKEFKKMTAQ